jgi:hypothetical protein
VLNRDEATVTVNVKATGIGSFEISFEVVQKLASQITALFAGESVVAAVNLKEILIGGGISLFWLIKKIRGRKPDKI